MRPARTGAAVALAAAAAVLPAGCASWLERPFAGLRDGPPTVALSPFARPVPCRGGPYPSHTETPHRRHTVVIGSLAFRDLGVRHPPERFAAGAPPLTVPVVVPPRSRAVIAVPPDRRAVAGLDSSPVPATTPAQAHRAVRCRTGGATRIVSVSFVLDGPRCLPVSVTIDRVTSTRNVAFGVRDCP